MDLVASVQHAVTVYRRARPELPVVVALDGRSGAGKSTLADAIAHDLGAALVHGDDFYRDMPDAERRALSAERGVDRFFDWERLRDEALIPLRARTAARY
ncbi:MAG: (d)CMP kinase, partial [Sphaerospermopsis kisseleviana]